MKKIVMIIILIFFLGFSINVTAAPISPNDNNDGPPDLYDAVNLLLGTSYTDNDDIMSRQTNNDEVWINMTGYGFEPWALIGLTAGYTNTFGVYSDIGVGANRTDLWTGSGFGYLGDGSSSNPFPGDKQNNAIAEGDDFGFYLYSNQANYLYSESALNLIPTKNGETDYMTTYILPELKDEYFWTFDGVNTEKWKVKSTAYLIGFEDIVGGGDMDFDDTMFLVAKVKPVPEPATMLLLSVGILGIAGFRKKMFKV